MNSEPLVSVVIPVRNGEVHLPACLDSVLSQSYGNFEVVIADNASTDRTHDLLNSYTDARIRRLANPPAGLTLHDNWERAIAAAKGEYLKIVCHDDLILPDCVATQMELLQLYPDAVLVSNRRRIIDDRDHVVIPARGLGRLPGPTGTSMNDGAHVAQACLQAGTNLLGEPACVLIRRNSLREPLLNPRWNYALDLEFYMRCLQSGPAVLDRRVLACFRVGPRQLSAALATSQARELQELFSELRERYPDVISDFDVRRGAALSSIWSISRGLIYTKMRAQETIANWFQKRTLTNTPDHTRS